MWTYDPTDLDTTTASGRLNVVRLLVGDTDTKTCNTCKDSLPLSMFHRNKRAKDGLQYRCKPCAKIAKKEYSKTNKKRISEYRKDYYADNKESELKSSKSFRENNKDYVVEYNRSYYQKNKERLKLYSLEYRKSNKELVSNNYKSWARRNRHLRNAIDSKRRAAETSSTPLWLTPEQEEEIKHIYFMAKDCEIVTGEKYHVDHIVPLQGKNICGLHVPWNLQVLPADLNLSKGNSYVDV